MLDNIDKFTKNVHQSSLWNIALRGVGILCGLLLLRLNISYLGATLYGLWATIASVSSWANFGDLGISNGLRNELTKAIANEDYVRQKSLIKSAVIMLSLIAVSLFCILTAVTEMLFATDIMQFELRTPMYITNGFFCLSFVLGISRTISYSYQKSWLASLAQTCTVLLQILIIAGLILFSVAPNLVSFAIAMGVGTVLGNLLIIVLLHNSLSKVIPINVVSHFDSRHRNAIMGIGIQFFVLQLCCLILYATDNVIINKLFSSDLVSKYTVITTVYNTGDSLFSLLLISLWSAVTYAATKNEYSWVMKEIKNLRQLWMAFSLGVVIVSLAFNWIVKIWLGDEAMCYEPMLVAVFALFTIANCFGAIYVNVANGLGRIKLQIICAVIGSVINIPLSIFLAKYCDLGLTGIKLATIICCFGSMVLVPIQVTRMLKRKICV